MASSASASGSSSRTYVDLTDDEFVGEIQARLRAELADNLKEMNRLRSQIRDLQSDNTVLLLELKETKDELKETRALLGQAVVTATRQKESSNVASRASTRSVPPPQPMRIRSPSIEVIDCAEKGKEKSTVEDTRPSTSKSTKCLSPNADVPPRNTAVKLEQSPTKRPLEVNPNAKKRPESSKRAKAEPVACAKEQSTSNSADTSGIQKAEGISHQAQGKAPIVPKPELKAEPKIILDLVSHHLHGAPTLHIDPPPSTVPVPRRLLRLAYGGSDMQFVQYFPNWDNPSGPPKRRLVFPQLNMNPAMPTEPGTPGLVFASRHEILYDPPWTLFHKVQNTKRAVWLYQGEYESVLSGTMTAEQFRGQRSEVKREWGDLLMTQVVCKPYLSMRSRIALRKAGLIPLEDKMAEKVLIDKEMLAVKSKGGHPVDADDIIAALERGDEGIDILRMTCIKYDHAFAKELEERLPTLPRLTEEAKKTAEETAKKASNTRKKPTVSVGLTSRTKKKKMATQRRMSKKSPPLETDEDSSADDFVGRGDNGTATTSSSVREFRPRKSTSQPFVSLVTDEEIEGGNSDDSDIMDLDFRY